MLGLKRKNRSPETNSGSDFMSTIYVQGNYFFLEYCNPLI